MLSVQQVSKRYGRMTVLDAATFEVPAGAVLAVVGSNGAGKSTLIKAIVGLVRYDGRIEIDGIDARRHGKQARQAIGYLPQTAAFHPDLTVRETAVFYARLRGLPDAEARRTVAAIGLAEHAEKLAGALSGGMRQRLALAVAGLGDPPLLVLDEPSSGLDVGARLELRRFVQEQRNRGRAIVFSTHWMEDVASVADTVLALNAGHTTYLGPAATFAQTTSIRSRMFMRLNGHSAEAITLLERVSPGGIAHTGDWIIVTGPAEEKGRVLEVLVTAGITILDVRVEDAGTAEAVHASVGMPIGGGA
jgi:ABC-type multidrug transport system ATPase subunit